MRYIDNFDIILLDVQMTFMFDVDRFDAREDFHATYRSIGGTTLSPYTVKNAILRCLEYILPLYKDETWFNKFPSLADAFTIACPDLQLPQTEWDLLEKTFALHERGTIPDAYATCLQQLATTHRLGIVSNIWAKKDVWLEEFAAKNVLDIFDVMTFSSDHSIIKPSPHLFEKAIRAFELPRSRMIFVGDNPAYDVKGAHASGLRAILATNGRSITKDYSPDHTIPNILHLLNN